MNADRLALWYRWVEYVAFGRALERSRDVFLPRLAGRRSVLVLGEGDGRTLRKMLTIAPRACIDVVEASPKMVALARARIGPTSRVRFLCADIRGTAIRKSHYDAVVACFFFDCFSEPELRVLLSRISPCLAPEGILLVTDFAIPGKGWSRWHARAWIWTMYRFFAATTGLRVRALPPIDQLLSEAGTRCAAQDVRRWGMLRSQLRVASTR